MEEEEKILYQSISNKNTYITKRLIFARNNTLKLQGEALPWERGAGQSITPARAHTACSAFTTSPASSHFYGNLPSSLFPLPALLLI